jgi:predicted metal-dependent HD superfamily phosphohydrolase
MDDTLKRAWHHLLDAWAIEPAAADDALQDVTDRYASHGRAYHTLDHVRAVLETVEALGSHARDLSSVRLAAWLHDVVYDSKASDNEARSAAYSEDLCGRLNIPRGPRVAALILATKSHDAGDDADSRVLLDADLAILGADEAAYRRYADQIRQEYAWVPEADYRMGRRRVLESFLSRPRIFYFLAWLEAPARRNIAAEIARLASP